MPKDIAESRRLDKENVNTLWWDFLCKEMKEVQIYYEEYDNEVVKLKDFHKIDCQIIFDVKMGNNFQSKAPLAAGGHTTKAPSSIT